MAGENNPNAHASVLAEFAMRILLSLFVKKKVHSTNKEHMTMLDPFIQVLAECLLDTHASFLLLTLKVS